MQAGGQEKWEWTFSDRYETNGTVDNSSSRDKKRERKDKTDVLSGEEEITGQRRGTTLGRKVKASEGKKKNPPDLPKPRVISQRQKGCLQERHQRRRNHGGERTPQTPNPDWKTEPNWVKVKLRKNSADHFFWHFELMSHSEATTWFLVFFLNSVEPTVEHLGGRWQTTALLGDPFLTHTVK